MTCEQVFDALHFEQWRQLAEWLGLDLAELLRLRPQEVLFVMVARKLDYMAARGRILH